MRAGGGCGLEAGVIRESGAPVGVAARAAGLGLGGHHLDLARLLQCAAGSGSGAGFLACRWVGLGWAGKAEGRRALTALAPAKAPTVATRELRACMVSVGGVEGGGGCGE